MYLCSVVNGQLIFSILWTLHLLLLTEFERTNAVVFSFIWVLRLFTLTGHQICFVKLSGYGYGNRFPMPKEACVCLSDSSGISQKVL